MLVTGVSLGLLEATVGGPLWRTVILALAFVKVLAIGYWFMDLRRAPTWLRSAFAIWVGAFALVLGVLSTTTLSP